MTDNRYRAVGFSFRQKNGALYRKTVTLTAEALSFDGEQTGDFFTKADILKPGFLAAGRRPEKIDKYG